MVTTHNLGFPRIGGRRELKTALEAYWKGASPASELAAVAASLRRRHWQRQAGLGLVPVGDFSLYDHVLDMSFTLGHVPERFAGLDAPPLDLYFAVARGWRQGEDQRPAGEMTKWFDTNYHYIVPEFTAATRFALDAHRLTTQLAEAREAGVARPKPVILGPVTYLALGKTADGSDRLALLDRLLPVYAALLAALAGAGAEWVQIDEPILATDLAPAWRAAFPRAYQALAGLGPRQLLATYFGALRENLSLACSLPVDGLHLDGLEDPAELAAAAVTLPAGRVLSAGVISGRNVWRTDLAATLDRLEPLAEQLGDRLWLAPAAPLLHVPVSLESETALDPELRSWLSFAEEKLAELDTLRRALTAGRAAVAPELAACREGLESRRASPRVHRPETAAALAAVRPEDGARLSPYPERARRQRERRPLPPFPTTTIGSFPQTAAIRQARGQFKSGKLAEPAYTAAMRAEIARAVAAQEELGLDVLVHGEAERNDMVEYFGEQLDGYVFSQFGWVQSYGSRCVKPPILFGDIRRPRPMTVEWIRYAQSLTQRPMKGMLTGPVTMLNWSFVRDDQPRAVTCRQLALAIRDEVRDLEAAGIAVIQIDEAALREGLPLRRSAWKTYLDWAVESFRLAANGVADETQIHTHMCYSEFHDILDAIAAMDADVITIETSRSGMELLAAFATFAYPNEIGPGVYDIHSPNIPTTAEITARLRQAAARIPAGRLWVNPDCGLKTRQWEEVLPALRRLVEAAHQLRQES